MMRRTLQLGLLALALTGAGGAQAVLLSDLLLPGATITAGDKVFDQFSVVSYAAGDGRQFNAANIDVTALNDGGNDPGPGLSFSVLGGEFNVAGDGIYNFVDLMFGFHVTAAAGFKIKDNSLYLDTATLGYTADGTESLGVSILEWASDSGLVTDPTTPGYINTEFSQNFGTPISVLSASSQFTPEQDYWFTKDILVWSANVGDTASLQAFTQRFSQEPTGTGNVPEPGTLALLALALVGVGVSRRRGTA
jgi:hypothetical protein